MCDIPLSFPIRHSPPIPDPASKQTNGKPARWSERMAAIPEIPAPMPHTKACDYCVCSSRRTTDIVRRLMHTSRSLSSVIRIDHTWDFRPM